MTPHPSKLIHFQAVGVETARPIERSRTFEIVPLDADALLEKVPEERTPLSRNRGPNRLLAKTHLPHKRHLLRVSLTNKQKNGKKVLLGQFRPACAFS